MTCSPRSAPTGVNLSNSSRRGYSQNSTRVLTASPAPSDSDYSSEPPAAQSTPRNPFLGTPQARSTPIGEGLRVLAGPPARPRRPANRRNSNGSPANATYNVPSPNLSPNATYNVSNRNATYSIPNANATYNISNPNATYNIPSPNATYNVSNRNNGTYNVPNPNATYNLSNTRRSSPARGSSPSASGGGGFTDLSSDGGSGGGSNGGNGQYGSGNFVIPSRDGQFFLTSDAGEKLTGSFQVGRLAGSYTVDGEFPDDTADDDDGGCPGVGLCGTTVINDTPQISNNTSSQPNGTFNMSPESQSPRPNKIFDIALGPKSADRKAMLRKLGESLRNCDDEENVNIQLNLASFQGQRRKIVLSQSGHKTV